MRKAFNPSKLMGFPRLKKGGGQPTDTGLGVDDVQHGATGRLHDGSNALRSGGAARPGGTARPRAGPTAGAAAGAAGGAAAHGYGDDGEEYDDDEYDDDEDLASTYDSQEPAYEEEEEQAGDDLTETGYGDEEEEPSTSGYAEEEYDGGEYTEQSGDADDYGDEEEYYEEEEDAETGGTSTRPSADYDEDESEYDEESAYDDDARGAPLEDYIAEEDEEDVASDDTLSGRGATNGMSAPVRRLVPAAAPPRGAHIAQAGSQRVRASAPEESDLLGPGAVAGAAASGAAAAGAGSLGAGAYAAGAAKRDPVPPPEPRGERFLRPFLRRGGDTETSTPTGTLSPPSGVSSRRQPGFLSRLQRIGQRQQRAEPVATEPDAFRSNSIIGRPRSAQPDTGMRAEPVAAPGAAGVRRVQNEPRREVRHSANVIAGNPRSSAATNPYEEDSYVDYEAMRGTKGAGQRTSGMSAAMMRTETSSEYTETSATAEQHHPMHGTSDEEDGEDAFAPTQEGDAVPGRPPKSTARGAEILVQDATRRRLPQLVDPFSGDVPLDRFARDVTRPESIEPSLFDTDGNSGQQPPSPLLPSTGPLSGKPPSFQDVAPQNLGAYMIDNGDGGDGRRSAATAREAVPAPPIIASDLSSLGAVSAQQSPAQTTQRQHGPSGSMTASSDFHSVSAPSDLSHLASPARIGARGARAVPAERGVPGVPEKGRAAGRARGGRGSAVPPVPPVPVVASSPGSSSVAPRVPPKALVSAAPQRAKPQDFRGLEYKTAHPSHHKRTGSRGHRISSTRGSGEGRRLPLPREPQKFLLTPSEAPTESDTEERAAEEERAASGAGGKDTRAWLLRDLSPEESHYFLREIVSKDLDWELDRAWLLTSFDKPIGRTRSTARTADDDSRADDFSEEDVAVEDDDEEAVFRRDVYDPNVASHVDLPLLRFLLKNAFCTFPLFVVPERRTANGQPPPNKVAIARAYFFAGILPILREVQARSLSAAVDRHGEGNGFPFAAQSTTRAIIMTLRKWAVRYIAAVLRVGHGNPYYGMEAGHNRALPWPEADLLPPEAYVSYRKPTDRLRFGGFEVDIVAVRTHSSHDRDFLLRIRRPNRMDEFVVRNDTDWDEFQAKLEQELGPFVHVRPLPRLPGRELHRRELHRRAQASSEGTGSSAYDDETQTETTGYDDESEYTEDYSEYDDEGSYLSDEYEEDESLGDATSASRPPRGVSAADILNPLSGRDRAPPKFEVDRRLLRSWLRDTLAIRSIAESQEVRAFLSIGSFSDRELDTNELLNIAERRRVDCRRIEEREKDAEHAGENVLGIRRVQQRIWLDCVDGDGFLKVYDALKATPNFWDLPTSYQTMVSWGNLQVARFLYGIFVQGDEARANLARVRDFIDAVPWRKLAAAMRLPAAQALAEWQKQFLRNRFLQTVFQIAFEDNPVAMDEDLRALQVAIGSDTMIKKLRAYVESPEDVKRLVRQHAQRADIPLVAAIVRGSDAPKLSKTEVQRVILATRAHADLHKTNPPNAKKAKEDSGVQLIVNLQRVLRLYSLHRDVTQIRGMLQDPTILDALTVFFEPICDALVRMHRIKGIHRDILDLRTYLYRVLDLLESLRARIQDPARSINMLASFLDRGVPGWYNFLHRWAEVDAVVFSSFAWLRHLAMTVGAGSEDLASIWDAPLEAMQEAARMGTDDGVENATTALRAASLAKLNAENNGAASRDAQQYHLDDAVLYEAEQLTEAARRKRSRQMEIACRWSAGDTEGDFSIQVFGDGSGRMRQEPFLPKEPRVAPKTSAIDRLTRSFREARN
ncbi:hypothetical protein MSPP1_002914 [Malassezia sp. CBS 17886]|nr:hypothetical protein MSPP1_002914 [Malassezia sp. CBS 17886]